MTHDQIIALQPGADMDQAVFSSVFGGIGKPAKFSTVESAGMKIMDRLPLFVGRVDTAHPKYDASRQWIAGVLKHNAEINGDMTALRVSAATKLTALCKAALLVVFQPQRLERQAPAVSSAEAAREVASRIGTPAARNARSPRVVPQPSARIHARDTRIPMPKRPEKFVGPDAKRNA